MALHQVIYLPDTRLRNKNARIDTFDSQLTTLIDDMFDTMYHAKGVGLAAPQIGINLQLTVIDVIGDKTNQYVLINPEIIASEGEIKYQEGCLSVPGAYDTVIRADKVTVRAQDPTGKTFEITADGLLGHCFQHEIDHLNGKLFIDHLSPIKRAMAKKKLEKFKRQQAG
ncbi:MAG: peptide deformylase [Gammaproteobacteria bacterium]|nr:peptide deformylase [Gammaproteobacteria bacterium]MCH9717172.1 peptide deformylase [Gammaproteobacteria bacterium]MCH9762860.1 peptide deformylase [Gammaproteobacteria bacterium]